MAERKQGPVKPPTIDLTARDATAGTEKPSRRTASRRPVADAAEPADQRIDAEEEVFAADEVSSPDDVVTPEDVLASDAEAPRQPESLSFADRPAPKMQRVPIGGIPWGPIGLAIVVGALLGTALTYVLATVVPLPGPALPNLAPELSAQGDRLTTIEERLGAAETGTLDTKSALDTTSTGLAARLAALEAGLAEVRASVPAPTDTTALEVRLRALNSRVDAIAAGASSADAGAIAENIGDLEQGVAELQTQIDTINANTTSSDPALASLEAEVAALRADLDTATAEPEPPAPTPVMPLVVTGLETAFATGRPFATELASLATSVPPVVVDDALAVRAGTGLIGPDVLDQQFAAAVPEMLAVRTSAPADWQQSAGDWFASLLAIRPVGEMEGTAPEAVISRLEGAMSRHDYAAASALFAELPPEMVVAAGTVPADIAAHAAAAALVAELRAKVAAP